MGFNTKCKFHHNEHPDSLCPRHEVIGNGPTRVVINSEGEAVTPGRARLDGIVPTVIFLRDDDWTLGAPAHLENVVRRMWADSWIGIARAPFKDFEPI